jgi:hypothetical protein
MQYNAIKSVVGSHKQTSSLQTATDSFFLQKSDVVPYIEPTFNKDEYPTKKPTILLVSAVGASGKSTTAKKLAFDTGLPILDLAKHKPVGDNTLTGILTSAYPIEKVGEVLEGFRKGTHGVIIDGIDEGRSKTTEQGFEAFLDDIIERSKGAETTPVIIFGRSHALLSAWCYMGDKGANVALVSINPFSLEQAKLYIDSYVSQTQSSHRILYEQARDAVLEKLGDAFTSAEQTKEAFLSFVGYPPVLDAIATLLKTEQNYHKITYSLNDGDDNNLEVNMLIRIADFLLRRERDEKAIPNFISQISSKADVDVSDKLLETLYDNVEQCARVLAFSLERAFPRRAINDFALNEEYEKALEPWCPEHPFLHEKRIRNAVFGAVAVSRCALSEIPEYQQLALDYTARNRPTYHLLYILSQLASSKQINCQFFNMLIQSCSDFMSKGHDLGIEVNGLSWDEPEGSSESSTDLVIMVTALDKKREFEFSSTVSNTASIILGPFIANTTVTLNCEVILKGAPALDAAGICRISAKKVQFETPDLIIRALPNQIDEVEAGLYLDAMQVQGHANFVTLKGGKCEIGCKEHSLAYPLAKYVYKTVKVISDPEVEAKYRRLRRILSEFASHSKGGLAKYRAKIEHERVMRGPLGWKILSQLLKESVLTSDTKFYYVDAEKLSKVFGMSWHDLRQYKMTSPTEAFLKRVT